MSLYEFTPLVSAYTASWASACTVHVLYTILAGNCRTFHNSSKNFSPKIFWNVLTNSWDTLHGLGLV